MAITKRQYAERVRSGLKQLGRDVDIKHIGIALPRALAELASQADRVEYPLLQKDFTVAMVAGVADLSTVADAVMTSLITNSIKNVRSAPDVDTGRQLEWQRSSSRSRLSDEKHPLNRVWWAVENNKLYAMKDDGITPPDDQTVTFNAHYTPTIASVPEDLVDELVDIGIRMGGQPPKSPEVDVA